MKTSTRVKLLCAALIPLLSFTPKPGSRFCGPYTRSKPLVIEGKNNITISGLEITASSGRCIWLINCNNVKIEKCSLGPAPDCGIELYQCTNVSITDCRIKNVSSGLYVIKSTGISFTYNQVENVQGPMPRGQMVQFNNCYGAGNRVNYNVCENILGRSNAEDAISMYQTKGTAADPVQIKGNWIRGGGPSKSGGGIMTGDTGGAYVIVEDNILVNPGQYGIGIGSGTNIKIVHNKIYSKKQPFTGTGLYIWKQSATACAADTISGNIVNWTNSAGAKDDFWNGGNCGIVTGWDTNIDSDSIGAEILPANIINLCSEDTGTAPVTHIHSAKNTQKPHTGTKGQ